MKKIEFVNVAIKASDRERLREIAEQEHRSMAQQVSYWIDQHKQRESA